MFKISVCASGTSSRYGTRRYVDDQGSISVVNCAALLRFISPAEVDEVRTSDCAYMMSVWPGVLAEY